MQPKKRIVITGMGVVSCFGHDVEKFYNHLLSGESGVQMINKFFCEDLPVRFGAAVTGFNPEDFLDKKQARRVDECISFGVAAGKLALQMANLYTEEERSCLDKSKIGVLIGSGMGGMQTFVEGVETLKDKGPRRVTPFFVPYILTNMPGALLSIEMGFQGPTYSISTACATANYSIVAAANHIQAGHADVMVCGGVEASMNRMCYAGFAAIKAISQRNDEPQKASRPWDVTRDGFVIGEGAGVIVLETLEHALARKANIIAEYKGGYVSSDAHHMTEPMPCGSGVAYCMEKALENAKLQKEDINYINAHATSTPVGDLCEVRAMKKVFGPLMQNISVNGTKSLIGHALGAAAGLEMVATLMAIKTKKLHPTINVNQPEAELEGIDIVAGKAKDFAIKAAMSNSFGFGGHNSCVIVAPYAS
ncbi:MAG: beta-ketoacyl-ACP synthase II [Chlamydiae bacterium]|nr:beta-ketoacyl-ACP synthase II [Chlamydiota bacterium]